jgi:hypothetical protein
VSRLFRKQDLEEFFVALVPVAIFSRTMTRDREGRRAVEYRKFPGTAKIMGITF